MNTNDSNASGHAHGAAAARSGEDGRGGERAATAPFSNTGRKIKQDQAVIGRETHLACETVFPPDFQSERVEFFATAKKTMIRQHPIPNESGVPGAAIVDWFAFTIRLPQGETHEWVIRELQRHNLVGVVEEMSGGYAGYASKAQCREDKTRLCLIAWGGKNQNGTVYVSFTGHGCARIDNWPAVQAWLQEHEARITRLDLAYDDFKAEKITMAKAVEWYQTGGFGAGGRKPKHVLVGDWLDGDESRYGRTFNVGARENGKVCRIYEKGKQLGDPISPWVRVEVEWHSQDRVIPYEALTERGKYLSGAYACLSFLCEEQSRIRTTQRAAKIAFDKAMENGKQLVGKLVNLALSVFQGDYAEVVERLKRDGIPARIAPYSYAIKDAPEILADAGGMADLVPGAVLAD